MLCIRNFSRIFICLLISLSSLTIDCEAKNHDKKKKKNKQHQERIVEPIIESFPWVNEPPPQWMLEQIHADLAPLSRSEITTEALDQFMHEYVQQGLSWIIVRYKIINNQVFEFESSTPIDMSRRDILRARSVHVTNALKKITQLIPLPDVDFIVSMEDAFDREGLPISIFAFAKNRNIHSKVILIPDFEALSGNANIMMEVGQGNQHYPWERKINRAIFRGSTTGGEFNCDNFLEFPRSKAVSLSLQYPQLVDARFAGYYPPSLESCFPNYFSAGVSVLNQIRYKYQLLIDGNSCAYSRAYWQFFSNCVILKQDSNNIQWYYGAIQPYIHYIPVNSDMSNLIEVIQRTMAHDEEAQMISNQAQEFAKSHLKHEQILEYIYHLLVEYGKLQSR